MLSSGQSCTNCHTKEEIIARDLVAKNLLDPGRFVTLYGATYDDTFRIAQFYDAQYADAMIYFSQHKSKEGNLVRQEQANLSRAPFEVRGILENATVPTAVVERNHRAYAVGREGRSAFDPFATAEVNAVREACLRSRRTGAFDSWSVDGELWTTSPGDIGPLLVAEAGWTRIGVVKSVRMPSEPENWETRETPQLDNGHFLGIIAGGYKEPRAAIAVLRDEYFCNTASRCGTRLEVNNEVLYNGAAVSDVILGMRDCFTRFRFAAEVLCNHCLGSPFREVQPLASLSDLALRR